MEPIPPEVGQLKFCITRTKSMISATTFQLALEKSKGGRVMVLYGKKLWKRTSYYLISLEKNSDRGATKDGQDVCLGKLRALNTEHDRFTLYDNGESYTKSGVQFKDLRKEHGCFLYRYEPCNVGNIRKMTILMPALKSMRVRSGGSVSADGSVAMLSHNKANSDATVHSANARGEGNATNDRRDDSSDRFSAVPPSQHQKGLGVRGARDSIGREIPDPDRYSYTFHDWRPTNDKETLLWQFQHNLDNVRNKRMKVFVDNPPAWNAKSNTYVYDFKGRVQEPSIKNFQLIPEADSMRKETLPDFVLQFGKRAKDEFILDAQFPLSIFQAFGLALSAFDTD